MKYKIEPVYVINYEVYDENGILKYDDRGDNLFETRDAAEKLVKELNNDATNTND